MAFSKNFHSSHNLTSIWHNIYIYMYIYICIYVCDLHGTHKQNESFLCGISTVPVSTYIIIDNLHELTILLGAGFVKDFLF